MRSLISIFLILILSACGKTKEDTGDVLLRYGENTITKEEVIAMIPHGLTQADSAALFTAIIEGWLRDVVLSEFAEQRLYDTRAIDRRVKDYRNNLIVQEYLSRMSESHPPKIEDNRVKDYYDLHRSEIKLEVPLVKGVFLKINSDSKGKEEIKNLLTSDDPDKIDRLERDWLDRSLSYNYFRDKWIDWETLAGMIPYRFGDPDQFISENKYFEKEYGDCNYYLHITDYLPSGEEQPFEFARGWITNVLTQGDLADYERVLVNSLLKEAIKDNKLAPVGYDPITHELKEKKDKDIK